jgi:hypothetical protein
MGSATMAGDTDFLALFQELGLSAGCRLDEFKLAFRRRVAQLHPDRKSNTGRDDDGPRLQRLIAMHDAAMDFHRRHGRLPGVQTQARHTPAPASAPTRAAVAATSHRPSNSTFIAIAALVLLLLAWWLIEAGPNEDGAEQSQATPQGERVQEAKISSTPHAYPRLALGMNRQEVLAVQGEPVSASQDQWEYGPSWIAFKCGKLSDWYNSPLRPLHAGSQHPLPTEPKPTYRAVDCAEGDLP